MTLEEAQAALARRGYQGRAADAAAQVITAGAKASEAAREQGIHPSAVTRLLGKLTRVETCKCCGHTNRRIVL